MPTDELKDFGRLIQQLIHHKDLTRDESYAAFQSILLSRQPDLQQGAFLAALSTKGETVSEILGAWQAIDEIDTHHVTPEGVGPLVENSGTGMDPLKTFNLSTAAAIVASACGVVMARHGARALTSSCGTVDLAEALGVDVESPVDCVKHSIEKIGLGLFNGMSPEVHPRALGRILSQIRFGSTLNTAASLAHPASPRRAVRGVYASHRLAPVTDLLQSIGFKNGMVVHGHTDDGADAMDEVSILGPTSIMEFDAHSRRHYRLLPEDCGFARGDLADLQPHPDRNREAIRFIKLLGGRDSATRRDALLLNTAAILRVASPTLDWQDGIIQARKAIETGAALQKLIDWVKTQNRDPQSGMTRLLAIFQAADMPSHFNHSHRN